MLFGRSSIDPDKTVLVFVHIPKTGGTSLIASMVQQMGDSAHLRTRMEKFDKFHRSSLHEAYDRWLRSVRTALAERNGRSVLLPRDFPPDRLAEGRLISGHFRLGREPRTGKTPAYVSILRDPVDRFVSEYYYIRENLDLYPVKRVLPNPMKRAVGERSIDEFVAWLAKRRRRGFRNIQCQYLSGSPSFAEAMAAVDERVFLCACAPLEDLDEFGRLVARAFSLREPAVSRHNVGRSRPEETRLAPATMERLRAFYDQDLLLYQYVKEQFAAYAEARAVTPS